MMDSVEAAQAELDMLKSDNLKVLKKYKKYKRKLRKLQKLAGVLAGSESDCSDSD